MVFAQAYATSEVPCVGRWAALHAGLPVEVPGFQLDRRCGGGLQAVITAAMMVQTGAADVVVAGGVESMSNIEHYTTGVRWGTRSGSVTLHDRLDRGRERSQPDRRFGPMSGMVETAENLARGYGVSREDADEYAARSHRAPPRHRRRAPSTTRSWRSRCRNVTPTTLMVTRDEGVRADTTAESLARLRPVMAGGTVTAGNAVPQSDAAAACLVVAEDRLGPLGLSAMGFLVDWAAVGCEPALMGAGPSPPWPSCSSGAGWVSTTWRSWSSTRRSRARCSRCSAGGIGTITIA